MKIKIIKAEPHKWYAKLVGKTRVARILWKGEDGDCFVMRNYRTVLRTIAKGDAEIIEP